MSHPQNDKLKEEFMDTLEKCHVCPYCGWEIDEYGACCGEAGHAERAYKDEAKEIILADEVDAAFSQWLEKRPA